ncbi:hypothetical protein [Falsirhodobacter sp. 20TX0035]|uniref:hypothetical protein n=1 Tax=Falsirhodobacter sp. 20TX0035 TaxID=3022019 RepID=UPI00232ACAB7|nr:hypothetical protein [Falsirhodobacter sp. 20TX0035]MDB6453633.1 hypothetical protein [Falsirhodobacter sp. 20TX0035]
MIDTSEDAIEDRLTLDPHEKSNRAWHLVHDPEDAFAKTELTRATCIGTATIARMRRRWRTMKAAGTEPRGQWWRDLRDSPNCEDVEQGQMTEEQRKAVIRQASRHCSMLVNASRFTAVQGKL